MIPDYPGSVYLLHFARPYAGRQQHYLGWTRNLLKRLEQHRNGDGGRTTRVAYLHGIGFTFARGWRGDHALELRLKREGYQCPLCDRQPSRPPSQC
jgi:predicted GIY-YIG superfamily endonuclease